MYNTQNNNLHYTNKHTVHVDNKQPEEITCNIHEKALDI